MTAKEYLNQAWNIDRRVNSKLHQVKTLRDLVTKATSTLGTEPVSGTKNVHRLEDTIDRIIDLENDINDDIDRLIDLKREVMATIGKVEDPNESMLLELRYLSFLSWDEIAVEMRFTARWVHVLHSKALVTVENILAA